jgi:predicted secreted protein
MSNLRHDRIEKVVFHDAIATSLTSGAGSVTINPTQFNTLNSVCESFALYKFSRIEFRLHPTGTRTHAQAAGYYPGTVDTAPTSDVAIMRNLSSVALGTSTTVPTEWVRLNSEDLKGYIPWYKTKVGTPANEFETQGNIYLYGIASELYYLEIRGVCEFKNQVDIAQTPALAPSDRVRLMALLGSSSLPSQAEPPRLPPRSPSVGPR